MILLSNEKKQELNFLFKFSVFTATFISLPLNWVNKFYLSYITDFSYLKVFGVIFLICFLMFNINQTLPKKTFSLFLNPIYEIFLKLSSIVPFQSKYLISLLVFYLIIVEPSFFKEYCAFSLKISILFFSFFRVIFFMFLSYRYFFSSIFLKEFSKTPFGNVYFQQQKNYGAEAFDKVPREHVKKAFGYAVTAVVAQSRCQDVGSTVIENGKGESKVCINTARQQEDKYTQLGETLKKNPPAIITTMADEKERAKLEAHTESIRQADEMAAKWSAQREDAINVRDMIAASNPTFVGAVKIMKAVGIPVTDEMEVQLRSLVKNEDELLDGDSSSSSIISSVLENIFCLFK